jgi:hypothetical protein
VAAGRSAVGDDAPVLDAVRAAEDVGERQVLDRLGAVVTRQRGDVHGLAGAVDAALGPGIDVKRAGCGAALDAAIRQVEAGLGHVEEDEVVGGVARHQHGRHHAALAARQAGVEGGAALFVGLGGAENLVVLGQQRQVDAGHRLCRAERAGEHRQAVLTGIGGEADVGDDEPLRGARIPGLALVVDRLRRQHVDAGLAGGQGLVDGEAGGDFLVQLVGDVELAFPHRRAELVGDGGDVIAVDLAQELVTGEKLGQRAVADAEELHLRLGHVDRDDRDAAARMGGQHEAVAGEAHRRAAILDVDRQHDRRADHFADRRGQAGAEGDAEVLAVF